MPLPVTVPEPAPAVVTVRACSARAVPEASSWTAPPGVPLTFTDMVGVPPVVGVKVRDTVQLAPPARGAAAQLFMTVNCVVAPARTDARLPVEASPSLVTVHT